MSVIACTYVCYMNLQAFDSRAIKDTNVGSHSIQLQAHLGTTADHAVQSAFRCLTLAPSRDNFIIKPCGTACLQALALAPSRDNNISKSDAEQPAFTLSSLPSRHLGT